jgi:hypothetical protein
MQVQVNAIASFTGHSMDNFISLPAGTISEASKTTALLEILIVRPSPWCNPFARIS